MAISYLDRYLTTVTVNRRIFQLAAMTAVYLAMKIHGGSCRLRISSMVDLSRGCFTAEHIEVMEESICSSLQWHLHPPTPWAFCRDLTRLIAEDVLCERTRHDINELVRFLTELSVCDYWFVTKKPSSIALGSIINAMELQELGSYKTEFMRVVLDIGLDLTHDVYDIMECYERLSDMYSAGGYSPADTSSAEEPEDAANGMNNIDTSLPAEDLADSRGTGSPNGVIPDRIGSRHEAAGEARMNLSSEMNEEAGLCEDDDLSQMECV